MFQIAILMYTKAISTVQLSTYYFSSAEGRYKKPIGIEKSKRGDHRFVAGHSRKRSNKEDIGED